MKNVMKKTVAILLIVCLLVAFSSVLFACNDDDGNDSASREEAVATIKDAFLKSVDSSWKNDLSNESLLSLESAGDYVVTKGWTDLVGRVLSISSLQTPKLSLLAEYMCSSEGKALLEDFAQNAELIITLLQDVGFTSADISSLIYGLLKEIVSSTRDMFDDLLVRLYEIKNDKNVSVVAIDSLNSAIGDINKAKSTYDSTFTAQDEQELLDAIEDAHAGINQLVAFAYNMSISQITDNIFNSLFASDGALSNITDDEVRSVVGALVNNVTQLKEFFTEQETARMNGALALIIEKFDTQTYMSSLFGQVVTYAKYAYMVLDSIPALCDIAEGAADAIDNAFLSALREYIENEADYSEETKVANVSILLAKLWSGITANLGDSGMLEVVDKLYQAAQGDYQKATPLFAVDLVVNTSALYNYVINGGDKNNLEMAHPDVVGVDEFVGMLNVTAILGSYFPQFKAEYYNYVNGDADALDRAYQIANNFSTYIDNAYTYTVQTELWYQTYVANVTSYLNDTASKYLDVARDDLKLFVEEYFAQDSAGMAAVEQLKNSAMLGVVASQEDIDECLQLAKDAGFYVVVALLTSLTMA